jgi:hypothetical protein
MTKSLNNNSDVKLHESLEIENFNKEKLREFHLNRDSRPSDPEQNLDPFKPTDNHFDMEGHSFEIELNGRKDTHDGVDDFDGEEYENRSIQNRKGLRPSLNEKYQFDAI